MGSTHSTALSVLGQSPSWKQLDELLDQQKLKDD
jgi:hypothetical protein